MHGMHAFIFPLLLTLVAGAEPLGPGNHLRDIKVEGHTRSYLVHVPPRYDRSQPAPVILAFHGALTNASLLRYYCGLNSKSDQAGFIAVYPNGTGPLNILQVFNVGLVRGPLAELLPDDVEFVRKLLDELPTLVNVDRRKIFATGISNGGMMCYLLAARMSDRIAAIAPVAGTLIGTAARPQRPVSVIHFHGTLDKLVPFVRTDKKSSRTAHWKSVEETISTWARFDGCPEKPEVRDEPDRADDGTRIERRTYGPGKHGAEVVLYVIHGGGHTWPGARRQADFLGPTTRDISANDLMWDFFERHPLD